MLFAVGMWFRLNCWSIIFNWKGLQSKSVTPNRAIASKSLADVTIPLSKLVASNYWLIRIAGISGAAAVCLAAYGRHGFKNAGKNQEYLHIYESANQMHFIHSIALVTAPLTKRPLIVSIYCSTNKQTKQ